jgi:putative protein-disulfide isomerase
MKSYLLLLLIFPLLSSTNKAPDLIDNRPEIVYVGDAMCSWCYAFSPEINKVKEEFKDKTSFRLVNGGLSPGTTMPIDRHMKKALQSNWEEICERTGLPFHYEILSKESKFIYDTEPPARAVVTIRQLKPEFEFAFFLAVQRAFYTQNKNTNDINSYLELLPVDVAKDKFTSLFNSPETIKKTEDDFSFSDSLAVSGYPSVYLKRGSQYTMITSGYTKAEIVISGINKELNK